MPEKMHGQKWLIWYFWYHFLVRGRGSRPETLWEMVEDMEIVKISLDMCKQMLRTWLRTWKLRICR